MTVRWIHTVNTYDPLMDLIRWRAVECMLMSVFFVSFSSIPSWSKIWAWLNRMDANTRKLRSTLHSEFLTSAYQKPIMPMSVFSCHFIDSIMIESNGCEHAKIDYADVRFLTFFSSSAFYLPFGPRQDPKIRNNTNSRTTNNSSNTTKSKRWLMSRRCCINGRIIHGKIRSLSFFSIHLSNPQAPRQSCEFGTYMFSTVILLYKTTYVSSI